MHQAAAEPLATLTLPCRARTAAGPVQHQRCGGARQDSIDLRRELGRALSCSGELLCAGARGRPRIGAKFHTRLVLGTDGAARRRPGRLFLHHDLEEVRSDAL
eukprot:4970523-Prymnesium_polylepis.1